MIKLNKNLILEAISLNESKTYDSFNGGVIGGVLVGAGSLANELYQGHDEYQTELTNEMTNEYHRLVTKFPQYDPRDIERHLLNAPAGSFNAYNNYVSSSVNGAIPLAATGAGVGVLVPHLIKDKDKDVK